MSPSGFDNDLGLHRRNPNFNVGVAIISKLFGQHLVQLIEEHYVRLNEIRYQIVLFQRSGNLQKMYIRACLGGSETYRFLFIQL